MSKVKSEWPNLLLLRSSGQFTQPGALEFPETDLDWEDGWGFWMTEEWFQNTKTVIISHSTHPCN